MLLSRILLQLFFIFSTFILQAAEKPEPNFTVMIPMRDGKELPADIYLPPGQDKDLPCILMRSPAGRKSHTWLLYAELAKEGYAVAIQDTRSADDKEGKTIPYQADGWGSLQDGYDTVEWLAKHPISNGKIATLGFSALGITQLMLAPAAPPSLKCQYIGIAASNLYDHAIYPGGQRLKNQVEGWLGLYAKHSSVFDKICEQHVYSEFWNDFNTNYVAHRVKSPGFLYGGWYDTFIQGILDAFVARQEQGGHGAKGQQKLLIGPWTHFWPKDTKLGDFIVPKTGYNPPYDFTPKRWFDYYLKDVRNGIDALPAVTYYVMGPFDGSPSKGHVWKTTDKWPVPCTPTPFYLAKEGKLSLKPSDEKDSVTYAYDHNLPVPTLGGCNLFLESGPTDQRPIEERKDVITFTSEPLKEDLEVTGRLTANIFFSSSQTFGDLVVRLTDVYPDGKSILIADGLKHFANKAPNEIQELTVDLWSTSMVFAKGHSIRISISNSNYPRFEHKNEAGVVENTIYFSKELLSSITLPVIHDSN